MNKRKPLALDLFCGGGGACIGMQRAGFEVVGIDIKPHKNYPGHFIQADIHNLPVSIDDFDFLWASPPCQKYSNATINRIKATLPDLIPIAREVLRGHPYSVIENVPVAPIHKILELTGLSVGLEYIQRRRHFELSFLCMQPPAPPLPRETWESGQAITVWTGLSCTNALQRERRKRAGLPTISKTEAKEKMGIPQHYEMTRREIGESVPPAYSEFIAKEALRQMRINP